MNARLDFATDGAGWPNREASRFVAAGGLSWHVQVMGQGPAALLLHGTGASSHSFARLAPLLARRFTVVAPDLPGHGFTDAPSHAHLSLPGMARAVGALLSALGLNPALGVGHSAGAAVLTRMELDGFLPGAPILSVNGALLPLQGLAGQLFAPIARMLALVPVTPQLFAWRMRDRKMTDELLSRTGSRLDPESLACYRLLFGNPAHVGGALGMMANWDLEGLAADLPRLRARVALLAGAMDEMVPPEDAARVARLLPAAVALRLRHLGHLAHEEASGLIARLAVNLADGEELALSPDEGRIMSAAPQRGAARARSSGSAITVTRHAVRPRADVMRRTQP